MNVFVLHTDPRIAAEMHCDKHCVKMIVESCQILSTVMHHHGVTGPYKPSHAKHPCVLWAAKSRSNFDWLMSLLRGLLDEYTLRYGKRHSCEDIYPQLINPVPSDLGLTPFALAMPDQYRCDDPVASYRAYYLGDKAYFAKWRNGRVPDWFRNKEIR